MVRFPGCILVGYNGIINPMVIGKKIVERAVPEMFGTRGMGKKLMLVAQIKIMGNSTWIGCIQRIQEMFFRLVVAALLVHRIIACGME